MSLSKRSDWRFKDGDIAQIVRGPFAGRIGEIYIPDRMGIVDGARQPLWHLAVSDLEPLLEVPDPWLLWLARKEPECKSPTVRLLLRQCFKSNAVNMRKAVQ